jgi:hypothetical protein
MKETKLSDFTEDQLRLMLRVMLSERASLLAHVASLKTNAVIELMMNSKIEEYELELDEMRQIEVQLIYAIQMKINENIVFSN